MVITIPLIPVLLCYFSHKEAESLSPPFELALLLTVGHRRDQMWCCVTSITRPQEPRGLHFYFLGSQVLHKSGLSSWRDNMVRGPGAWETRGGKQMPLTNSQTCLLVGLPWIPKPSAQLNAATWVTLNKITWSRITVLWTQIFTEPWETINHFFKLLRFGLFCYTKWTETLNKLRSLMTFLPFSCACP